MLNEPLLLTEVGSTRDPAAWRAWAVALAPYPDERPGDHAYSASVTLLD